MELRLIDFTCDGAIKMPDNFPVAAVLPGPNLSRFKRFQTKHEDLIITGR